MSDDIEELTSERQALQDAQYRYLTAMHAMQAGVATKMQFDQTETSPKHLRVGVNSAMLQQSALAKLLIEKGIITETDWFSAIAELAENEVRLYEQWLSNATGQKINLG